MQIAGRSSPEPISGPHTAAGCSNFQGDTPSDSIHTVRCIEAENDEVIGKGGKDNAEIIAGQGNGR